jgi:glutathione S-transferase
LGGVELFGSLTSPYVRQCRVVALDTGARFRLVEVDPADSGSHTPTARIPFLKDGDVVLTDSASITRYLREKAGQVFLPTVADQDLFSLAGTVLDTSINLFQFERHDGLLPSQSKYLAKQAARVASGLRAMSEGPLPSELPLGDAAIRIACLLAWGRFRKRFSLEGFERLERFLDLADSWQPFVQTTPPTQGLPPRI